MRKLAISLGSLALAGAAFQQLPAAIASPVAVQKVVDARVAKFKQIGTAGKAIAEEFDRPKPNLSTVQANARVIEALARQIPSWFPNGSGQQPGVKSGALPTIWRQVPAFEQRAAGLVGAARETSTAAGAGDFAATAAAVDHIGAACKACHETFRQRS